MKLSKAHIFDSFWLKIIGFISMTFDHVGLFLSMEGYYETAKIFRYIGRIAFPLFLFMVVEGIRHSSNIPKYIKRLLTILVPMLVVQLVIIYSFKMTGLNFENPYVALIVIALFLYFLTFKDKRKFLSLIPVAYCIFCLVLKIMDRYYLNTSFFPSFLRMPYTPFAIVLATGFYLSHLISKKLFKNNDNKDTYQIVSNILCSVALVLTNIILLTCELIFNKDLFSMDMQIYSLFSILFILFYNGKLGYNSKGFRIFSYLYFPLHLVIIFAVFMLISIL